VVSLLGFSQGAILSYAIAFITSRKISKVIVGYLNEEIIEENYRNNDFSNHLHPME
jgi:phospholipase/carboxylesterase